MKANTVLLILGILVLIGLGLLAWAFYIIINYDGYMEMVTEASNAAQLQLFGGIVVMFGAYLIMKFTKIK